ncbi:MAG: carbonic anhydrase [Verrucomicrobiota bacterium]|nr:carbonic anhydrase [Verrucomicrobiota bacterium]
MQRVCFVPRTVRYYPWLFRLACAAEQFGARLVVVLEHQNCSAVAATLKELKRPTENRSPNLGTIVDRIRPAVEPLISTSANDATLL